MDRTEEVALKHERLRRLLAERGLSGVLLRRRDNFAWVTAGGRSVINEAQETGVAAVLVTPEKLTLITNNIERDRLLEEELAGLGIEAATFDWWRPADQAALVEKLAGGGELGVDAGGDGQNVAGDLLTLRAALTEGEIERYRVDAPAVVEAIEAAARRTQPGMDERRAAGLLRGELAARGFRAPVCLAGADGRIDRHRHPLVAEGRIERRLMLVTVAERCGLCTATTRIVHFGGVDEATAQRQRAVCDVQSAGIVATRPGRPMREVLEAMRAEYDRLGFADQWQLHHQGGPTGYAPRDAIVNFATETPVQAGQAFAWNPTVPGVKCEDTFVATDEGPWMLTGPGEGWPVIESECGGRTFRCADVLAL